MPARKLPSMTLPDLLGDLLPSRNLPAVPVQGITLDSRDCDEGYVYFALEGHVVHGLDYCESAVAKGAIAIVADESDAERLSELQQRLPDVILICVHSLRQRLGEIAARYYGNDADAVSMIGVTGTDGKTSVSQFVAFGLQNLGHQPAVIGTNGWGMYGNLQTASLTTPDAISLQKQIAELRKSGASHICMEVSSHALDQWRCSGIDFRVVVLTNLSRDHLDYHETVDAYAEAKARLFKLGSPAAAVINADDDFGQSLLVEDLAAERLIAFGATAGVALRIESVRQTRSGLSFSLEEGEQPLDVQTQLLGNFNAENVVAAIGALDGLGFSTKDAVVAMQGVSAVSGRMELFSLPNGVTAVVDFAHTAKALAAALQSLRAVCERELWVVFGCGGDRDRGKRPEMAEQAQLHADRLVLTSDNPRTENAQRIFDDMKEGLTASANFELIEDRKVAIINALDQAAAGDVVLIAGKGHEAYQQIGEEKRPFRDQDVIRSWQEGRI